jgi:hypothetical protein
MPAQYLISNLDDLKDAARAMNRLVQANSDEDQISSNLKKIALEFTALNTSKGSYILSFDIPEDYLK